MVTPKIQIDGQQAFQKITGIEISFGERIIPHLFNRQRDQIWQPDVLAYHDAQVLNAELTQRNAA
jgi:hypothetical protein